MQRYENNEFKIYSVTSTKNTFHWLNSDKGRRIKNDKNEKKKVELLQDLEMPDVTDTINVSPDRNYIVTTGTYKPRIKSYDLNEMGLKFDRCTDHEVIRTCFVEKDCSKLVALRSDRYVEFHTFGEVYYKTRLPTFCRDVVYNKANCDLLMCGGSSVYNLNLNAGQFKVPYFTEKDASISCMSINDELEVFSCGSDEGLVYFFDARSETNNYIYKLNVNSPVTSCKFFDEFYFLLGNDIGEVFAYDIRNYRPMYSRDHRYSSPVTKIETFTSKNLFSKKIVASCDRHCVKIFDLYDNKLITTIENEQPINDFVHFPESGLFIFANEFAKSEIYFLPEIDPAPRWCSFLDNLTEELEQVNREFDVYEDYNFVTEKQLEQLGLAHMIGGTELIAAHHGYYVSKKVYKEAMSKNSNLTYQQLKRLRVKEQLMQERQDRIKTMRLPSVNKELATEILTKKRGKITNSDLVNPLNDDRFGRLFHDESYAIDRTSREYFFFHKSAFNKSKQDKNQNNENNQDELDEIYDRVEEELVNEEMARLNLHNENEYDICDVPKDGLFEKSQVPIQELLNENEFVKNNTNKNKNDLTQFQNMEIKYVPKRKKAAAKK